MDKVVTFRANDPTAQGAGNKDGYTDLLTTRGYLKRNSGNRDGSFGDILGNESWYLIVRKQAALIAGLSMALKVVVDGAEFTVHGWQDVEEKHFYYKFDLTKQVNNAAIS